jgi:outer membrane protein OmpA-like peptidoglycan-associated protein
MVFMKKIALVFTIILIGLSVVAYSQETSKKEERKAKKEYRKTKKEFFNNFYNPQTYEHLNTVIVKDTIITTTFQVYDIYTDNYSADENLTLNEKESIGRMANALRSNKIIFDTDSDIPKIESEDFITEVAKILLEEPTLNLMIEAYTGDRDTDKQNRELAFRRAKNISDLFIQKGVNPSRLNVKGHIFGEAESQFNNRVVVFRINRKR